MTPSQRNSEPTRSASDLPEKPGLTLCRVAWLLGGLALAGGMAVIAWGRAQKGGNASMLIWGQVAVGVAYLALLAVRPRHVNGRLVMAMLLLAVAMRLPWFFLPAESGHDYCRYLWDGAVAAHGINPYRHAPQDVASGHVADPTLQRLAETGRKTLDGINHPHLRTLYPPAAQGAFGLAYWIAPFDLTGWRVVLLAFDALAALAAWGLLRWAGLSPALMFIYLWNPLLIAETYGGGHVDILAGAMVAVFAWSLVAKRPVAAGVSLVLAIGAKLWPVLLLPFLFRVFWGRWRSLALSSAVVAVGLAFLAVPFAAAFGTSTDSGLLTYARIWEGRAGAYQAFGELGWWLHGRYALSSDGHYIGRGLMLFVLLPAVLWLGLRRAQAPTVLCRRMGWVALLMLLLGPVLWPWYYVAVIPLAAVAAPRVGLLLWTALLPLCYLEASGLSATHLTWLVHAPVWLALAVEGAWPRCVRRFGREAVHV